MRERNPLTGAKRVVLCGVLAAVMVALQVAMSPLPNIEPVSLLVMVYTIVFGRAVYYIVVPFVVLEGLIYGFGIWWFSYLYVWPLWAAVVLWLGRKERTPQIWAVASGVFGLSFGGLCALPYLAGGPWAALSWWLSGIPFDVLHCGGNFVMALILQRPLCQLLCRLRDRMGA